MPSDDPVRRFRDIIDEIDYVTNATDGMSFDSFVADPTIRRAIERAYAIISEAAIKLGHVAENHAPEIPWRDIRGLGNVIRHEYSEVDYETLWDIRSIDLAPLRAACLNALDQLKSAPEPTNGLD